MFPDLELVDNGSLHSTGRMDLFIRRLMPGADGTWFRTLTDQKGAGQFLYDEYKVQYATLDKSYRRSGGAREPAMIRQEREAIATICANKFKYVRLSDSDARNTDNPAIRTGFIWIKAVVHRSLVLDGPALLTVLCDNHHLHHDTQLYT